MSAVRCQLKGFKGFSSTKFSKISHYGFLLMSKEIGKDYMDPSKPLSKSLPFKALKRDNGCFPGTVQTGKLFWDTRYYKKHDYWVSQKKTFSI